MDFWASVAEGATVLAADASMARGLRQRYGERQQAAGRTAWETPAIVPWETWVRENFVWEGRRGMVLSPEQELLLWEEAIGDHSALLDRRGTARSAAEAWRRVRAWRLPETGTDWGESDDTAAFHAWAQAFRSRCEKRGWLTAAELPDAVIAGFHERRVPAPKQVWLAGFERISPQLEALVNALRGAGAAVSAMPLPEPVEGFTVWQAADYDQELRRAAQWAKEQTGTVGVVVPGLAQQRGRVERIFASVLEPAREPWSEAARIAHVSGGEPLSNVPIIAAALTVVRVAIDGYERLETRHAIELLRSPYISGADSERAARAREEKKLRQHEFAGRDFWHHTGRSELRRERASWPERQAYGAWAEAIERALAAMGWPGERALSKAEQRAVNAWQDVLGALARLDQIALETPPIERFWRRLLALIEERAFRPPAESPRVMVMGWNENCGLEFDHLWIAGMEEDALTPANPHPFLPLRWHRELFGADRAAGEIWARWRRSARDQVVSYSATPHTLLNGVSAAAFGADAAAPPAMPMLVDFEDAPVPLLSGGDMPGGTQFFEAQSACPFRGFAHYRLHARGLPEVPSGRNARQRGTLLHKMLERVYREIPSRELLLSLPEAALGECVRACARTVVDAEGELRERPQLARVEEQRLERQTLDWLEKEKKREPWTAIAWERQENVALGGLRFNIKIDRVDRLPGSGDRLLVIDYKSGEQSMSGWNGERPLHPQLPLYLLASPESSTIEGIALAQLKPGKMQLKSALRGGKAFQMAEWRAALLELARQIEAGEAPVRPKFPRQPICERCDLHTLCRIRERDARWGDTGDEELSDAE